MPKIVLDLRDSDEWELMEADESSHTEVLRRASCRWDDVADYLADV